VKSIAELVGGCLAATTDGAALAVLARRAIEMAETNAVKATILSDLNNILREFMNDVWFEQYLERSVE
jgi:hypothetical protein